MTCKKLALVLGNCLFDDYSALKNEETLFFLAEDRGLCTHFKYHKHKIILFLSAMRSYADKLRSDGNALEYFQLGDEDLSYEDKLSKTLEREDQIDEIVTYDIEDHFFKNRISDFCVQRGLKLSLVSSPGFICGHDEFNKYLNASKNPRMYVFYQQQRKNLNILVEANNEPLNGKWSFDEENRNKLPKKIVIPSMSNLKKTEHTKDVIELVDEVFTDHPGGSHNFNWATTREQALYCLNLFLRERFDQFGPYEDAISRDEVFVFHSVLSPYINMGLLTPTEVVKAALDYAESHSVQYSSLEGFVRQIIGWREFMRGIYHAYGEEGLNKNFFGHERKMNLCWYNGTTGVEALDDSIKKAVKHGYTHHIERLMVLGNIMLLCEIDPDEVYKWFMEMYVDSSDWVMAPNVYGMSQFADGGIFATKPYIGGANYIAKMSNYPKKGEWVDIVNGLYWRFIDVNRDVFAKNQRMSMMTRMLDKMDMDRRKMLMEKANKFIDEVTL